MAVTSIATGTGTTSPLNTTAIDLMTAASAGGTTAGVFVLIVDLGQMANGDVVELRILQKIQSGTERLAYYAVYAHAQAQPMKYSVPIPSIGTATDALHFTLTQTAGAFTRTYLYRTVTIG